MQITMKKKKNNVKWQNNFLMIGRYDLYFGGSVLIVSYRETLHFFTFCEFLTCYIFWKLLNVPGHSHVDEIQTQIFSLNYIHMLINGGGGISATVNGIGRLWCSNPTIREDGSGSRWSDTWVRGSTFWSITTLKEFLSDKTAFFFSKTPVVLNGHWQVVFVWQKRKSPGIGIIIGKREMWRGTRLIDHMTSASAEPRR